MKKRRVEMRTAEEAAQCIAEMLAMFLNKKGKFRQHILDGLSVDEIVTAHARLNRAIELGGGDAAQLQAAKRLKLIIKTDRDRRQQLQCLDVQAIAAQ